MKYRQHETYSFQSRRLKRSVRVLLLKIIKRLKEVAK
ncbi:hypothetical protein M643_07685 [Listeria monocytogenes]|nr:hypothetical protein M643_07685 [Listeria monocytogenes]AOA49257.1 hypothetical protein pLM-C-273_00056 [Listeria monocytogenes]